MLTACRDRTPPARSDASPAEERPVTVTVGAASALAPGRPLRVEARFAVAPGWHIYGKEPGDAGLPTRVSWTAPAGFQVGEVEYPPDKRFESPGNITSFGYEHSVVLPATITPPATHAGPVTLRARVSWLACREVCIPGKQELTLDLTPEGAKP